MLPRWLWILLGFLLFPAVPLVMLVCYSVSFAGWSADMEGAVASMGSVFGIIWLLACACGQPGYVSLATRQRQQRRREEWLELKATCTQYRVLKEFGPEKVLEARRAAEVAAGWDRVFKIATELHPGRGSLDVLRAYMNPYDEYGQLVCWAYTLFGQPHDTLEMEIEESLEAVRNCSALTTGVHWTYGL